MRATRRTTVGLGAVAVAIFAAVPAHAGEIGHAAAAARGSSSGSSSGTPSRGRGGGGGDGDCCSDGADAWFWQILMWPWTIPNAVLGHGGDMNYTFADHPYSGGESRLLRFGQPIWPPGYVEIVDGVEVSELPPPPGQHFALQASAEAGSSFDVHRASVALRMMLNFPAELEARWSMLWEPLAGGDDFAALGSEHLTWRFAQGESVQFRTGIGVQHFIESAAVPADGGADAGATAAPNATAPRTTQVHNGGDFVYGFQAMVGRPLVLDGELHLGWVGDAFLWQGRATLGAMIGALEIYGGYHHIALGGVELGGPLAGVRYWW